MHLTWTSLSRISGSSDQLGELLGDFISMDRSNHIYLYQNSVTLKPSQTVRHDKSFVCERVTGGLEL